jgi:hemolysin III
VRLAAVYRSPREGYAGGAVVYTFRRSDPLPRVFGYNELFHAPTIVALACRYVAVGVFVVAVG